MSHGGKGDKPRPYSVSKEEFDNRFEAIFGKKKKKEETMEIPGTIGSAELVFKEEQDGTDKV